MSNNLNVELKNCLDKIRVIANPHRFRILELVSAEAMNIKSISRNIGLSYTKCADYVRMLEKEGLVAKTRKGRDTMVKSNVLLKDDAIIFNKTKTKI